MRQHAAEALGAAALALAITLAVAAPVVRAPSERVFGAEIVGRHHDPFTVMQQFERPLTLGVYSQPVTDLTGAAIARATGPVAAYNWLVLLSFPLSAAATYLLARYLALPPAGALFAALLFAFSPFHVAHAAYHPQVAQTQWLPLYLLALWRCLDRGTWSAVAFLAAAIAAVTLSNFYGGLIAAVITPIAAGGYWLARARFAPHPARRLAVTGGALAALALAGLAFVWWSAAPVVRDPGAFAFAREDLFHYSAAWWSYLVPPVVHPLFGATARRIWIASHVDVGLLEQQVSLGWSVIALAAIAVAADLRVGPRLTAMLAAIGAAAFVCSLAPERTLLGATVPAPSALLYVIVPMFRSYARFGVIVQLMAALLAAIGAARLLARRTGPARALAAALVILAIVEYAVRPSALSRDVLPTEAHRWVMRQTAGSRVFDCQPFNLESAAVPWLTDGRIILADEASSDCAEPQLAARLWASGFTHVIVRDTWERPWLQSHAVANGLVPAARFADADVFAINPSALVYTMAITGFWPREHRGGTSWRWMGADASWTIVAPAPRPRVTLELDLHAFHVTRPLVVGLDGVDAQTIDVDQDDRTYRIGPLALSAGPHQLTFHSAAATTPADAFIGNGDRRPLAFSVGAWKWSVE